MERYSEYKDSGVQWLGEIPSHWKTMPLKSFVKFEKGKTPKEFSNDNNGLPYLTMDYLRSRDNKMVKYPLSNVGLFEIEDSEAIVLWDGANAGEFLLSKKGYLGSTMAKISGYRKYYEKGYFYYFLKMLEPTSKDFANGTTIPHFDASILMDYHYPIPPLDEQRRIGSYLDAATSELDKAIAMQQKMIDLLNERKQIIIQNAVTKGLDKNVEMKDSGVEWIGMIPKHWVIRKIKTVASFNPLPQTKFHNDDVIGYLPMERLGIGQMNPSEIAFGKLPVGLNYFENGDIVMAKVTPCFENGKIAIAENLKNGCAFGTSEIFVYRPKCINSKFLLYCLQNEKLKSVCASTMMGTGGLKRVNANFAKNVFIAMPTSKKEQERIESFLDVEIHTVDNAIDNISRQITLLQERKQIIINEVVTGKVKVS